MGVHYGCEIKKEYIYIKKYPNKNPNLLVQLLIKPIVVVNNNTDSSYNRFKEYNYFLKKSPNFVSKLTDLFGVSWAQNNMTPDILTN